MQVHVVLPRLSNELAEPLQSVVSVRNNIFAVSRVHVCKLLPRFQQSLITSLITSAIVDQVIVLLNESLHEFQFSSFWPHNDFFCIT